mmetsp:Transcript_139066/g.387922  ORF Transcript_139066/g.387922 Transcript_139066/m.387922 type:complete len:204 (+) Transcript_139066:1040-1651(+)
MRASARRPRGSGARGRPCRTPGGAARTAAASCLHAPRALQMPPPWPWARRGTAGCQGPWRRPPGIAGRRLQPWASRAPTRRRWRWSWSTAGRLCMAARTPGPAGQRYIGPPRKAGAMCASCCSRPRRTPGTRTRRARLRWTTPEREGSAPRPPSWAAGGPQRRWGRRVSCWPSRAAAASAPTTGGLTRTRRAYEGALPASRDN